jgi:DNA-binding beta-propeller fold protein YncE
MGSTLLSVCVPMLLVVSGSALAGLALSPRTELGGFSAESSPSSANATVVDTISLPAAFFEFAPTFVASHDELYLLAGSGIETINGSTNRYAGEIPGPFDAYTVLGGPLVYDSANQELYEVWENETLGPEFQHSYLAAFSTVTDRLVSETLLSTGSSGVHAPLDGATYDPANGNLYVPLGGEPGIVAIVSGSSNTLRSNITVGDTPETPTLDPSNGDLYVSNLQSQNISVISGMTDTVVGAVSLGSAPTSTSISTASIDPEDGTLCVASTLSRGDGSAPVDYVQTLSIASQTVVANYTVSVGASAPILDASVNEFIVGSVRNVTVINASTGVPAATIATEPLLSPANYFALDPSTQLLYAASPAPPGLAVISLVTDRDVANVTLGTNPNTDISGPTFDSANGEVYVPVAIGASPEVLVIGAQGPATPGSSSLSTLLEVGAAIGLVAVVAGAVILLRRRRGRGA